MTKYEIMYILRDGLEEEVRKEAINKLHTILTTLGAEIADVAEWGSRELAYEIKDQKKGYYVVLKINAESAAINEFDRLAKINPLVLRHLVVVDRSKK